MGNDEQISGGSKEADETPAARPRCTVVRAGYAVASLAGLALVAFVTVSAVSPGHRSRAHDPRRAIVAREAAPHSSAMPAMPGMVMPEPAVPVLASNRPCTRAACPIAIPGPDELSVAGRLGASMATLWIRPHGRRDQARVELLNLNLQPVVERMSFAGNARRRACGPGCWILTLPRGQAHLKISVHERGHRRTVSLPLRWRHGSSAAARDLVDEATGTMRGLAGVKLDERTATGEPGTPGDFDDVHFVLSAPDAMSATITGYKDKQVTIGDTQWTYTPGVGWLTGSYNGDATGTFTTSSMFTWHEDEQSAQILSESRGRDPVAVIALMNPKVPAWLRLTVQKRTGRVTRAAIITDGRFTIDRFSEYGAVQHIVPPVRSGR